MKKAPFFVFLTALGLLGGQALAAQQPPQSSHGRRTAAAAQQDRRTAPAKAAGKKKNNAKSRAASGKTGSAAPSSQSAQKKGLEKQSRDLQQQIGRLRQDISQKQVQKRKEASAAQTAKKELNASNQKLERLDTEKTKTRSILNNIRVQSGQVVSKLATTRQNIAVNAKLRYLHAGEKPWESVLSGTSPAKVNRNAAVLAYLADRHQQKADRLEDTKDLLQHQAEKTASREKTLTAVAATEKANNQRIAAGQELHEANARKLEQQISSQQKQVEELQRDQQRLAALIRQIDIAIAEQEKARRQKLARQREELKRKAEERRKREAALAEKNRQTGRTSRPPAPKEEPEMPPEEPARGSFAKLRGRLPMPTSGTIAGNFGQSRNGAGVWQGLMIRASQGSPVRAVAEGTVVYAGKLRGYGNLLILDHGEGYLSVYAYNSALLKANGAHASGGETIARVGPGENGNAPGLYFEIRYKGRPINPRPWLK